MDHPVNEIMHNELSFLTPTQTEVITTLSRLFPNVSKDVLVVTLTSPDIYYDGIDKLLLLNRCMDEMEFQSQVVDLTGRFTPPTDTASVASTSKPTINNNIIKVPSSSSDNSMPSVSVDALQGTSFSSVEDEKEKILPEPVIFVSDSAEDGKKEESDGDDVTQVRLRGENETLIANKVGSSKNTLLDENILLDYLSDSSSSPPEVILLPDDNETISSTLEMKNMMNTAGLSGKLSAFQNKNLLVSEAPKKESSQPWRKLADNSQKGHAFLGSEGDVPLLPTKVTGDLKNSLDSSSINVDVSRTIDHQKQGFDSKPASGLKLTPVHSSMQKNPEVNAQPSTSSESSVILTALNVTKDKGSTQLSGSSSMGSTAGLPSSSNGYLPSGSNLASSPTCKIHRGIKQCKCKGLIAASTKSAQEVLSKDSVQKSPITHRELGAGKSHPQSFPLKSTSETDKSATTPKHHSQTPKHSGKHHHASSSSPKHSGKHHHASSSSPKHSGKHHHASSSSAGIISKKSLHLEKPQPGTSQPVKQSGDSFLKSGIHLVHPGSSSQAVGHVRETSHKSKFAVSTPQTVKHTSAGSSGMGNTYQPCSKMTMKEALSLARASAAGTPKMVNSTKGSTQAASLTDVRKAQELKKSTSTSQAGRNPTGSFNVGKTIAGTSTSTNHSTITSQISQNKGTDTPGKSQTGPPPSLAYPVRLTQAGVGVNPLTIPQTSSAQVIQNKGTDTPGKLQTGPLPSPAYRVRPTPAGVVVNSTARPRPSSAQVSQNKATDTPGKAQTGTHSSPTFHVRHLQTGMILDPTARAQPFGRQHAILNVANLKDIQTRLQDIKDLYQQRNNINAATLATRNLPGTSQANVTASGNTQTVLMAEQVLGNAAFLPRNVALNQGQRQNNARPENVFHVPQNVAPTPLVQNGIVGGGAIRQGVCQVHGGFHCNCPPPYQDRDIFEVTEQAAVDVSPFMAKVFSLFPDADPDFVKQKLQTVAQSVPDPVQWVCNLMLEDSYPRKQVPVRPKTPPPSTSKPKDFDYVNKWRELPRIENRSNYISEARQVLAFAFKLISMASIDEVMRATNYRFTPSFVVLEKIVVSKEYIKAEKSNLRPVTHHSSNPNLSICCELPGERPGLPNGKKFEERRFRIRLNRKPRTSMMPCTNNELKKEMEYYKNYVREKQEEQDHQMALNVNQEEYEQNQQGIECECCFAENPFENMVQCFEMHLFCCDCLQRYVKEAIFGQGKGNLACMATDCSSTFPRDQIEKTLPPDLLAKYDERCREESVHLADLEDLVRCPNCQYAATLALEIKAFLCPQCGKETCRNCQQDWKEHFGKKCEELESRTEEQLRTKYEEKLTEALVRTCHRCKASIVKENGCNKMTCRCGAKMCYICRKPNIDYNHFCQHVRDPSRKGCNRCNACCLWEVAEVVDEKKMIEIKNEMKEEQEQKGVDEMKRSIGVPENVGAGPSKKPRTQ